ncbi:MFS transporter [Terriglobus saanensis]|uniref:Major facilitator superfamily MFS_1 n=1 Tax=Terriglobus saanensis (strain ATCC BAA-1853 / DSM 23119 / SP1PR4) TaxID=401053 RepID=E8V5A3_TERSS|nr:MFS transporter [Terriglobus saanensis]ADV84862.1 major facilitator superfamily MFS_1 [Terriglobus saanensis SP1PR4]
MRKSILALTTSAFGIGTSEFIIMGLLPDLARSFSVSIPKAGLLVSAYAISVTIGSPLVALALSRVERKRSLVLLMGIFVLGNLACALAPTFGFLLAARILTALCHGAFFGTGSIVASNLVPKEKRSQAIAMMFTGLTLANVLGVPAGTALGHAFGWRYSFVALLPVGILAILGLIFFVPEQASEPVRLRHELTTVLKPKVQVVLALSTLSSVSLFTVFTYIAPMLGTVTHLAPNAITWVLVLFGAGITIGNIVGGKLSDWRQMTTILGGMALVMAVLLVMPFVEPHALPIALTVFVWGLVHFAAAVPLQARIVEKARAAPNLASTLNQGAFNFGNALGASLGGLVLTAGYSYRSLPFVAAGVIVLVLLLALAARHLDKTQLSEPDLVFDRSSFHMH